MELVVKSPPGNAGDIGDDVRSLGREDPLEDGMETHSSIPACMLVQTHEWTKKINGMENRSVTDPKTERLSI